MKKVLAAVFIVITVFNIYYPISYSNSPPLVMKGDTAFPISHDHIKLESEIINIYFKSREIDDWRIGHEVEVLFNFHNQGPDTELDIGFPNTANYGEKLRDFQAMDYPSMEPYKTEIKSGGTLPEHDMYMYTSMYSWKMHFKENEKKSLYVKYWFEGSTRDSTADYILITGALWKDRIDKIDVYVHFPEPAAYPSIFGSPKNYYYNGEGIEWHFEDIEPDFNLFVNHVEYPPSFELEDEYYRPRWTDPDDYYIWDDHFYWIDTFPYEYEMANIPLHMVQDMTQIRTIVEDIKGTNQCIVNEIYARNGYVFKTYNWKNLFEEALWYSPDTGFSTDKFNSIEKFNLKYIEEFKEAARTDVSDESLVESIEKFVNKYYLEHEPDYAQYYYLYNYNDLKREKDRIQLVRMLNSKAVSLLENDLDYYGPAHSVNIGENNQVRKGPYRTIKMSNGRQMELYSDGVYLKDSEGSFRKILEYAPQKYEVDNGINNVNRSGPGFDDIRVSPDENYVILGTNYRLEEYSGITRNVVYIASINEDTSYIAGYGNINDYRFWWSPSEKVFSYQNRKTEPGILKIYNTENSSFVKVNLPGEGIDSLEITEDQKILMQSGNKIYFMDAGSVNNETVSFTGTLLGAGDSGVYFYKGEKIYNAPFNDLRPVQVNKSAHSIWQTAKINDDIYCLYGGASNLSVYNISENRLYHYKNLDYYGLIQSSFEHYGTINPSPKGDKIFIYKDYIDFYEGTNVKKAFVVFESGYDIQVTAADETADWIDNDNLAVRIYGSAGEPILEYSHNVSSGTRLLLNSRIDTFNSRIVSELESGLYNLHYERNKKYTDLKHELLSNAYIVSESANVYSNADLTQKTNRPLKKGSLIGVLEIGDNCSKICFFTNTNSLWTGWIKNSDYTADINDIEPVQAFVYDAKVYEMEGHLKRKVLESCSSQVEILDKKPGWFYINAANKVFGWVEGQDIEYGFKIEKGSEARRRNLQDSYQQYE